MWIGKVQKFTTAWSSLKKPRFCGQIHALHTLNIITTPVSLQALCDSPFLPEAQWRREQ
jgi:hypothetical protein